MWKTIRTPSVKAKAWYDTAQPKSVVLWGMGAGMSGRQRARLWTATELHGSNDGIYLHLRRTARKEFPHVQTSCVEHHGPGPSQETHSNTDLAVNCTAMTQPVRMSHCGCRCVPVVSHSLLIQSYRYVCSTHVREAEAVEIRKLRGYALPYLHAQIVDLGARLTSHCSRCAEGRRAQLAVLRQQLVQAVQCPSAATLELQTTKHRQRVKSICMGLQNVAATTE
jgi:hypothetical protein